MTHPPHPSAPAPARGGRRTLIIALVVVSLGALLMTLLAVGTVTYLMLSRGGAPEPGAAPEPPAYEATRPMTQVTTEDYSFSYPRGWAEQDVSDLQGTMVYALRAQDATETSRLLVMDFLVQGTIEDECAAQAEDAHYTEQPAVQIDGRPAQHFQREYEDDETGEPVVADMWCTAPRQFHVLLIVTHTVGPEAEEAGISEGQLVIDSVRWTGEEE